MKKYIPYFLFLSVIFNSYSSYSQQITEDPLNPDFVNYLSQKDEGTLITTTQDGYGLGLIPSPVKHNFDAFYATHKKIRGAKFSALYDMRTAGYVTSVKNQGSCGSCWTFATMGSVESRWKVLGLGTFDLSEDNLNNCHNFDYAPCSGGTAEMSTAYFSKRHGPISEADDPYTATPGYCPLALSPLAYVTDARFLPNDADVIKQTLLDYGALYVSMRWEDASFNSGNNTYYYSGSDYANHAITLVGWDDNKVTAGGTGAWIFKNSWGASWGESGFFYISYNDTKVLSDNAYFPVRIDYIPSSEIYYYDYYGETGDKGFASPTGYGLTKYETSNNQQITKIGTYIAASNASVKIEIYDDFNGTTLTNLLDSITTQACEFPGYYTFDLPSPLFLANGNDFYIKIKYYTPGYNTPIPVENVTPGYASNVTTETGKCWISNNGTSWTPVGNGTSKDYDLCIKAYAIAAGPPIADFTSDFTDFCDAPVNVQFINNSSNANSFLWYFGDGDTSTQTSPIHTYTNIGIYDVKLIAYGDSTFGDDSITKTNFINIDPSNPCIVIMPQSGAGETQTSCSGILYDSGGNDNYHNSTNSIVTIAPISALSITINFISFNFEQGWDSLFIYDGSDTLSTLIGGYTGNSLPNGGTIVSSGGEITFRQFSDQAVTESGFELNWQCSYPNTPPVADFSASDTASCTGNIQFTDLSSNGPNIWHWDFGDGDTSNVQNPSHFYTTNDTFSVKLFVSNYYGEDSLFKNDFIIINRPEQPVTTSAARCDSGSVTLSASGTGILCWYDDSINGNLLDTGTTFNTPVLGQTTTYYVENDIEQSSQYTGKPDNSGGGSIFTAANKHYLVFDCYSPVTLVSVKVYAQGAGNRTIELRDNNSVVLQSTTVNIPDGESRVNLNFDIPVANNLQLTGQESPDLYRNNNGVSYPYEISGLISVKYSSAGASPYQYYYFFYDWEIKELSCKSARTPATATIILPAASVTPNGNISICYNDSITLTSQQADTYLWYPTGDTTQSITVTDSGSYYVEITDSVCSAISLPVIISHDTLPIANFGYIYESTTVNFYDASVGTDTYFWDFDDGDTSVVQNPSHTYIANGDYNVSLIVSNACGSDTTSNTIHIYYVDIKDNSMLTNLDIFPNPTNKMLYINFMSQQKQYVEINLINLIGCKLWTDKSHLFKGNYYNNSIDLSDYPKGIYFIRINTKNEVITQKIIVY